MQFLAPLFFAGLAALAVPVLLHLRRQRPKKTVSFSAVMFLDRSDPPLQSKRRLQHLLLLLLRCLAAALLIFAFTRPFFPSGLSGLVSSEAETTKMILVDTSASMRGPRFEQAVAEAGKIIDSSSPADIVALAAFDQSLHPVISIEQSKAMPPGNRRSAALAALRSLTAGWSGTDLGNAITSASDLFTPESGQAVFAGKLYVISDFQKGADFSALKGFSYAPNLQVIPVPIQSSSWTNAGVQILPPPAGAANSVRQRARVTNSEGSAKSRFTLAWEGQPPVHVDLPPGDNTLLAYPSSPVPKGHISLTGDDFPFDNEAWFVDRQIRSVGVDFLGTPAPGDTTDTLFFLLSALKDGPGYSVNVHPGLNPSAGDRAFMVIDRAVDPAQLPAVSEWIRQGHVALLVLRANSPSDAVSALVGSTAPVTEASVSDYALIGRITYDDPVFQPFSDQRFADFSKIHVWKYRKLDLSGLPVALPIARFDTGDPALVRIPVGSGTLFVLTTSWAPKESQLALSSKFAPLLHSLLAQSPALKPVPPAFQIGEKVTLPPGVSPEVVLPDGRTSPAVDGLFSDTALPGLYRTRDDKFAFAVNLSPSESELTPLSPADLATLGLPLESGLSPAAERTRQLSLAALEIERRQKVWWWLVLATLMILIAETVVARYQGGRTVSP